MALTKVKAGNILLTTPGASSNDVTPATTQYVTTALANLADSAPSTLNTLNELAAALGDDANFSTTVTNSIAAKAPLASPSFTGNADVAGNTFVNSGNGGGVALKIGGEGGNGLKTQYVLASGHTNFQIGVATHAASVFSITPSTAAGNTTFTNAALNINASGSVGIGTTNPQRKLVLYQGDSGQTQIQFQNVTTGSVAGDGFGVGLDSAEKGFIWNYEGNDTYIGGAGGTSITIQNGGNVGIGTGNPSSELDIFNATGPTIGLGYNGGGGNGGTIDWNLEVVSTPLTAQIAAIDDGNYRMNMIFSTKTAASASSGMTERMRISGTGLVDIGQGYTANAHAPVLRLSGMSSAAYSGGLEWYSGYGPKTTAEMHSTASGSQGGEWWLTCRNQNSNTQSKVMSVNNVGRLRLSGLSEACSGAFNIMGEVGNSYDAIQFYHNSMTLVGRIRTTASSTAYNTSSDYRLKENVDYTWDATTRLKQLKPARFNFIVDDTNTLVDGFLAHEVSSVVPEAITGTKDAVDGEGNPDYQGIDQSKLVPLLVKTIQELEARITTLEG